MPVSGEKQEQRGPDAGHQSRFLGFIFPAVFLGEITTSTNASAAASMLPQLTGRSWSSVPVCGMFAQRQNPEAPLPHFKPATLANGKSIEYNPG
jgi:hypothetical protein